MQRVLWYIGNALMLAGLIALPMALIVGVGANNVGGEYLLFFAGGAAFLVGMFIRSSAEGK